MNGLKCLAMAAVVGTFFGMTAPKAQAQVVIGVGAAPMCPYGYYDYSPYSCAPYGYYGPEWFTDGVFIGVGPWFRGHAEFRGHVDNHYDVQHGYRGPMPNRGDRPEPTKRPGMTANFRGNEVRDGRGHTGESGH